MKNFTYTYLLIIALFLAPSVSYAEDWTYSVRPGDTLWELCEKFTKISNCWQKIGPYNAVVFPRSLKPGTRIRFPVEWLRSEPKPATITTTKGSAYLVTEDGTKSPVQSGSTINMGSILVVDPESVVNVLFGNGASMVIEGEAEVLFDQMSVNPEGSMIDTKINLKKGAIQTQVPKRKPAIQFEVHTPSAVAAVRGTNFRVSATNTLDQSTRNEVFEGEVNVSNATHSSSVPKGYGILANKGLQLPDKVKLLPAPKITAPSALSKQAAATAAEQADEQGPLKKDSFPLLKKLPQKISWRKIKSATHYKVQIFDHSNNALVWSNSTSTRSTTVEELKNGCFELRISGIDKQEFQGMPTHKNFCLEAKLSAPTGITTALDYIEWQPVRNASSYMIQLSNDSSFTHSTSHRTMNTHIQIDNIKQFKYFRIQAIDATESPGLFSKVTPTSEDNSKKGLILFAVISLIFIGI